MLTNLSPLTYGFVLKILSNRDKYSPAQIEKALRLKQLYGQLDICPNCKAAAPYVLIQKLGMCGFCDNWERYNKKYD